MATLMDDIHKHEESFNERAELYADYYSDMTPLEVDTFRHELLRHLAGSIVVKEHRHRYQRE
jgi:hypothetical protein